MSRDNVDIISLIWFNGEIRKWCALKFYNEVIKISSWQRIPLNRYFTSERKKENIPPRGK